MLDTMDASELDLNLDKDVTQAVDWVADASIASLPSRSVFLSRSSLTESQTGYWGLFGGALGSQQLLTMDVRLPSSAGLVLSRFGRRTRITLLLEYLVPNNIITDYYTPSVDTYAIQPFAPLNTSNSFTHIITSGPLSPAVPPKLLAGPQQRGSSTLLRSTE